MVNKKNSLDKEHYSVSEAAALLGISRVAVHKRIITGKLKAKKIGHSYVIPASAITELAAGELTDKLKEEISKSVQRVLREYGETLKLLGKE